jgi:uncharacterized membrane protein YcgQ (UPF0703/DUF1980 family)
LGYLCTAAKRLSAIHAQLVRVNPIWCMRVLSGMRAEGGTLTSQIFRAEGGTLTSQIFRAEGGTLTSQIFRAEGGSASLRRFLYVHIMSTGTCVSCDMEICI